MAEFVEMQIPTSYNQINNLLYKNEVFNILNIYFLDESFTIVKYYDNTVVITYRRTVLLNSDWSNLFTRLGYNILKYFFNKTIILDDDVKIINSKYIKHEFIGRLFKDYVRDKKLKELGIYD